MISVADQHRAMGAMLLTQVRQADARVPAERRVPRTAAEMRARINTRLGQSCGQCDGAGGRTEDTSSGGVSRQNWVTCTACRGTGVA
ncbi:hypothetical protein ACJ6WD_35330 [Streptomyces sp. VTCC 41912]|uniref:hypothetical protein n=1 Tax=Streptomyces sp. VTCC 41912 TaxID=3383243 RepID=UPI003896DBFB